MARFKVGDVVETKYNGEIEVLEKKSQSYYVRFLNTGYERWAHSGQLYKGLISDPYSRTVAGVGYVGEGDYKPSQHPKTYSKWCNMVNRCYNTNHAGYQAYGARGVTVCEEWLCFQTYAAWHDSNYIAGYHLDKDLLSEGGKVYSPDSCCFLPREINNIVIGKVQRWVDSTKHLPTGVISSPSGYKAKVGNTLTKVKELSEFFDTPEAAYVAYRKRKIEVVQELADLYYEQGRISSRVHQALLQWQPN